MKKHFPYIDRQTAERLLSAIQNLTPSKRGFDRRTFLFDEYAVLSTSQLKRRNVDTIDDNLTYFNELMSTLMALHHQGVCVVPILGYCVEEDSPEGDGYLIEQRAKGEELYDDAILSRYEVWTQKNPSANYLKSDANGEEYLPARARFLSLIPQAHYDKFIRDMIILCDQDILIDCNGKSNFFYHPEVGFQFIDLDSHTDYRYGLCSEKTDSRKLTSLLGFVPCLFAEGSKAFAGVALAEKALSPFAPSLLEQLAQDNRTVFEKCRAAMRNGGIPDEMIAASLEKLKIFGC